MKVLNIAGSPRKQGNTNKIVKFFTDKAEEYGAEVKTYNLNTMNYKGCQGCGGCQTKFDHCVQKDDLTELLREMREYDVTVFSSPNYYGDVTGQYKLFLDRTYSHVNISDYTSRLPQGNKALFIFTQGTGLNDHKDAIEKHSYYLKLYGYDLNILRSVGVKEDNSNDLSSEKEQAEKIADEIFNL